MTVTDEHADRLTAPCVPVHAVHFYRSEAEFTERVGAYVEDGLKAGEVAIIVATPSHRGALTQRLADSGIDVETSKSTGSLTMGDAAETLSLFMVDERPDPLRFASVMGTLIRTAAQGRPVRIFGEMVAVLWEAGQVPAAMDLESLWNELLAGSGDRLLCAYPADSFGIDADVAGELCRLHSEVLGRPVGRPPSERRVSAPLAVRTFGGKLADATQARRFVVDTLSRSGFEAMTDDAALVVTELAANAIVHARSAFTVTVGSFDQGIEIAVFDEGPLAPRLTDAASLESTGRGLALVAALAARWGSASDGAGKIVWAEFSGPRMG